MSCLKTNSSAICNNIISTVDCIQTIYSGETYSIPIQIYDTDGTAMNLDIVKYMEIDILDIRNFVIAKYKHPKIFESYIDDSLNDDLSNLWYDNLDINILQLTIDEYQDLYLNKGKVSITLKSELTTYLMFGKLNANIKVIKNDDSVHIIKCLNVGIVNKI